MEDMNNNLNNDSLNDFDMLRNELMKNPVPSSNFETSVYMLKNSELTEELSEIEKEIKLSNIDLSEKKIILSLLNSYQDQILLESMQMKRYKDYFLKNINELSQENIEELLEMEEYFKNKKFDRTNHLRRALSIAVTSRGFNGFEREKQVQTIQTTNLNTPQEQQKKGLISNIFGGLR